LEAVEGSKKFSAIILYTKVDPDIHSGMQLRRTEKLALID